MGGGEGEMERGVGRERGQEGRVRDKEMDGETDRDEWLSRRAEQHMDMERGRKGGRGGGRRKEGGREGGRGGGRRKAGGRGGGRRKEGGREGGRKGERGGGREEELVLLPHLSCSCGLQQVSAYPPIPGFLSTSLLLSLLPHLLFLELRAHDQHREEGGREVEREGGRVGGREGEGGKGREGRKEGRRDGGRKEARKREKEGGKGVRGEDTTIYFV